MRPRSPRRRFVDPAPRLKRQLAAELIALTSVEDKYLAALSLGVDHARLSNLRQGRLVRFSLQRLVRMMAALGRRVELTSAPWDDPYVSYVHRHPFELPLPPRTRAREARIRELEIAGELEPPR